MIFLNSHFLGICTRSRGDKNYFHFHSYSRFHLSPTHTLCCKVLTQCSAINFPTLLLLRTASESSVHFFYYVIPETGKKKKRKKSIKSPTWMKIEIQKNRKRIFFLVFTSLSLVLSAINCPLSFWHIIECPPPATVRTSWMLCFVSWLGCVLSSESRSEVSFSTFTLFSGIFSCIVDVEMFNERSRAHKCYHIFHEFYYTAFYAPLYFLCYHFFSLCHLLGWQWKWETKNFSSPHTEIILSLIKHTQTRYKNRRKSENYVHFLS